ncbi:MAG: M48 family metalloprotease [Bacteroidota bacterium]
MKKLILLVFIFILSVSASKAQFFKNFNVFSVDDDIKLGKQLRDEIANDPVTYPVLDEKKYPEAYAILRGMTQKILDSGDLQYRDKFEWEVRIIHQDSVLNAFVTPGGYIYVYTGLIHYLDSEDHLAGVMGHEIAHADRRHSTRNMTKQYGLSVVLGVLLGRNPGKLSEILGGLTGNLAGLKFNRDLEAEADAYSVQYLSKTDYQCNGAAGFFAKLLEEGNSQSPPQFLSTHPSSESRVEDINAQAREIGCSTESSFSNYQKLKDSLPRR